MLNSCILPMIEDINREFGTLHSTPGIGLVSSSSSQVSRMITCPSSPGKKIPFNLQQAINKSLLPFNDETNSASLQLKSTHQIVDCLSPTGQKRQSCVFDEKGFRNPSSFLPLIKPFIDIITSPKISKAVLFKKSLYDILSSFILGKNLLDPLSALPLLKQNLIVGVNYL